MSTSYSTPAGPIHSSNVGLYTTLDNFVGAAIPCWTKISYVANFDGRFQLDWTMKTHVSFQYFIDQY